MTKISPSILAGDFLHLESEINVLEQSNVDYIHYDIMDGVFVPNITFGFKFVKSLNEKSNLKADVHLMIVEPEKYLADFIDAGAGILTFHYETVKAPIRFLSEIKKTGCQAGIAINPSTPVSVLQDIIQDIDVILLMSVEPGFYGQKFIEASFERIKNLKKMIDQKKCSTLIEVDGGVQMKNYKQLIDSGSDMFVIGNDFFKQQNPADYVATIKAYK